MINITNAAKNFKESLNGNANIMIESIALMNVNVNVRPASKKNISRLVYLLNIEMNTTGNNGNMHGVNNVINPAKKLKRYIQIKYLSFFYVYGLFFLEM